MQHDAAASSLVLAITPCMRVGTVGEHVNTAANNPTIVAQLAKKQMTSYKPYVKRFGAQQVLCLDRNVTRSAPFGTW